jgi:hypothetical protein
VDSFVIEVREPDRRPRRLTITSTIELGRECNGVILADGDASRRHAALTPGVDGLTLTDMGSSNGTFANGRRVGAPIVVRTGDVIRIGSTEVAIVEQQAAPPPTSSAPPSAPTRMLVVRPPAHTPAPVVDAGRPASAAPRVSAMLAAYLDDDATLTARFGPSAASLVNWFLALVRHHVAGNGGREVAAGPTAVCAAFASVPQAVACAVAAQRSLDERNAPGGPSLLARMVVHASATVDRGPTELVYQVAALARGADLLVTAVALAACNGEVGLPVDPPRATVRDEAGSEVNVHAVRWR